MPIRTIVLLLISWVCSAACASTETAEPVTPPGHTSAILDDEGAILVLRGVNVENAAKGAEDRLARVGEEDVHRIARRWGSFSITPGNFGGRAISH